MQQKQKERPKGLGWRALLALAGMIVAMFGSGCSRIHGGYMRGTIPSQADLEKRVHDANAPLTDSERDHFAGLLVGTGVNMGVCQSGDTYLQCRARLQEPSVSARTRNTVLCTIACGESSSLLTICINNDVPGSHPEIGTSITCDAAVDTTLREARENVGTLILAEREASDRGRAEADAMTEERDQARQRAETAERELAQLRAQQTQPTPPPPVEPPTVAIAPETPRRHQGHGAHHGGGHHGRRAVATRDPAAEPELNHALNGSGMMCTAAVPQRDGTWTTSCEVRNTSEASGSLLARLGGVEGMHASRATTGVARIHRPHSTPRIARGVVAQIIQDNVASANCGSALILACRPTGWHVGQPYYAQRVGVCTEATNNHDGQATTLETFTADATEHCGEHANIEVWGLSGHRVRLRFDREPAMEWQPPSPTPAPHASLTPRTQPTRALALSSPAPRLNARYAEVTARTGVTTRGFIASRIMTATIDWWFDPRWRPWVPSALA